MSSEHHHNLDRELNELLQELRVIQGGILLLIGFLLVIAFSSGFPIVTEFQKITYYATLIVTGASALVVVAPVVHHRVAFRKHDKESVVVRGNLCVLVSVWLVALSILGIVILISDYLYGPTAAWILTGLYVASVVVLWVILPLQSVRRSQRDLTA